MGDRYARLRELAAAGRADYADLLRRLEGGPDADAAHFKALRAAEQCPWRDCSDAAGCGCRGCRCRPGGRRAGERVTIDQCLSCVEAAGLTGGAAMR